LVQAPAWDFPGSEVIFDAFAAGGALVVVLAIRRLWAGDDAPGRRATLFLALWLILEVLAYYPLTPFPATRRVLGSLVVLTLLIGRLAARAWPTQARRRAAWPWVVCGTVLALGFFALDWREAYAEEWGAEQAAAWIKARGEGHAWYVGHYGFQYYAERNGMEAAWQALDDATPPHLRSGDWVARPDGRVASQLLAFDAPALREVTQLTLEDRVPLRTVSCYYCGRAPLEHHEGPRITVRIYRVVEDYDPR